jgi:hypothetical protein
MTIIILLLTAVVLLLVLILSRMPPCTQQGRLRELSKQEEEIAKGIINLQRIARQVEVSKQRYVQTADICIRKGDPVAIRTFPRMNIS